MACQVGWLLRRSREPSLLQAHLSGSSSLGIEPPSRRPLLSQLHCSCFLRLLQLPLEHCYHCYTAVTPTIARYHDRDYAYDEDYDCDEASITATTTATTTTRTADHSHCYCYYYYYYHRHHNDRNNDVQDSIRHVQWCRACRVSLAEISRRLRSQGTGGFRLRADVLQPRIRPPTPYYKDPTIQGTILGYNIFRTPK